MKLFLASEAKNPKALKKLDEYVGGLKGKKIAYIPTALNGNVGWERWKEGGGWKAVNSLGAEVTVVQLEDYADSAAVEHLRNKDIIWVAVGYAGYLMYWMIRCEIDKYLPQILENGTVYVGSSAGSMITSKNIEFAEWYKDEGERGARNIPGLGLVDFEFWPHYEDEHDEYIEQHYNGEKMYLVKNEEVIIVENGKVEVFGEERIVNGKN